MSTDAVLADIDGALAAYGTVGGDWASPDAMSWSPEKPELVICHGTGLLMPERWNVWRHGTYTVIIDEVNWDQLAAGMQSLSRVMTGWTQSFAELGENIAKVSAEAFGFTWMAGDLHYHAEDAPRRELLRCPLCHPHANPPRLAIDGRGYRRRQLARSRKQR